MCVTLKWVYLCVECVCVLCNVEFYVACVILKWTVYFFWVECVSCVSSRLC